MSCPTSPPPRTRAACLGVTPVRRTTRDRVRCIARIALCVASRRVARERIAALRAEHLTEGAHFRNVRNAVVLTASGLEIIVAALAPRSAPAPADKSPQPQAAACPDGPPERVTMVVRRVPPNLRLLLASKLDDRTERVVRVRDNRLFMPGMSLTVIHCGSGLFQFTGRLPRRKGKW